MRVGLVLGAGGVVGVSWLIGALEALAGETGLDVGSAEFVVGSSAGAIVGAAGASGVSPAQMSAYLDGGTMDPAAASEDRAGSLTARVEATAFQLQRGLPSLGPGSWRMALTTLRQPRRHSPGACLAGWLPRGFVSTEPVSRLVETMAGPGWPAHPNLWVMATDYGDGRRVAFGRAGAPRARIADAVAASCAIPGFYHPVAIGRRRYVDGGVCSVSNLDVLCGRGLDLVVCLSPSSSLAPLEGRTPWARMAAIARAQAGRRLGHEARKLRAEGTEVLLVQPAAEDLVLMGSNPMARTRRVAIAELAVRTTTRDLRARRTELEALRLRRRRVASAPQTARRAA